MTTYNWITSPTPEHLYTGRTIAELKNNTKLYSFSIIRIKFRFETVYCAISEGELVTQKGYKNIPIIQRCLIVNGENYHAIGSPDPYSPFNSIGIKDGDWTDVGRAWVGATFDKG